MFEFEFSVRKKRTGFWIDQAGIAILSPETKAFIATHAVCRACKQSVGATMQECVCATPRRHCAVLHFSYGMYGGYLIPREQGEVLVRLVRRDRKRVDGRKAAAVRKERKDDAWGKHTKDDIRALWVIQNGECYFCGDSLKPISEKRPFAIDHLLPLASGGNEWPSNIALLCQHCNQTKHTKSERLFWRILESRLGHDVLAAQMEKAVMVRPLRLEVSNARRKAAKAKRKAPRTRRETTE